MIPPARHRRQKAASPAATFAVPLLLFFASLAGLVMGLTGNGLPDVISWAFLALPLAALALSWARRG